MSYNPVNWVNGETPINDTNLNNMDNGIAEAHEILADHDKKIDVFVKGQIPEEYVKGAVDDYISENQAGLASKEVVEEVAEEVGKLSSEIADRANGYIPLIIIEGSYVEKDGTITPYATWNRTDYTEIVGDKITLYSVGTPDYNHFYDEYKNPIGESFVLSKGKHDYSVPSGAKYFILSGNPTTVAGLRYYSKYFEQIEKNKDMAENLNLRTYIDETIVESKTYPIPIKQTEQGKIVISLTNSSDSDGYVNVRFMSGEYSKGGFTQLVKSMETYVNDSVVLKGDIDRIEVINTNSKVIAVSILSSYALPLIESYHGAKILYAGVVVADASGKGDATTVKGACDIAKARYDVMNENVLVYVKNGVYNEVLNPNGVSCIDKGANRISIIGESKSNTIIRLVNTAETQNKVLDVGGACVIANLSIYCLASADYVGDTSKSNPYCIHNDTYFDTEENYTTEIRDCYLYSECEAPIGAGLRKNQRQEYINVECVYDSKIHVGDTQGALYVHSPNMANEDNCSLLIDSCTCISKNGGVALLLPRVVGVSDFSNIPVTIRRTIGVTNGTQVTNVVKGTTEGYHNLTMDSALNNMESCNY